MSFYARTDIYPSGDVTNPSSRLGRFSDNSACAYLYFGGFKVIVMSLCIFVWNLHVHIYIYIYIYYVVLWGASQ